MPQDARYQVAVGLRHGGGFISTELSCRVPDGASLETVQGELFDTLQAELAQSLRAEAVFDLGRCERATLTPALGWDFIGLRGARWPDGSVAVVAAEIAWLQVVVLSMSPVQTSPPATGATGGEKGAELSV